MPLRRFNKRDSPGLTGDAGASEATIGKQGAADQLKNALSNDVMDHVSMYIGEAEVSAFVAESEFLVVHAE